MWAQELTHALALDLEWEAGCPGTLGTKRPPSGRSSGTVSGPRPAVEAVLMRVSGVQAVALGAGCLIRASSGGPFGGGIWGIFPGHITLNPAILWVSWKVFNLLHDLSLYKCPSCIISQMCFYSEQLGTPVDRAVFCWGRSWFRTEHAAQGGGHEQC